MQSFKSFLFQVVKCIVKSFIPFLYQCLPVTWCWDRILTQWFVSSVLLLLWKVVVMEPLPLPPPSIGLSIQFHAGNYKTSSIKSKCHKNLNLNFTNHNIDLEGHKLTGWHFLPNPRDSKYLPLECFCRRLYFVIR